MEGKEDDGMILAMTGMAFFGAVIFIMWYMLRSCKNKTKDEFDPSNPQSRGRYRPAQMSTNDDDVP